MKRIAIFSLGIIDNIGDHILCDTTAYLVGEHAVTHELMPLGKDLLRSNPLGVVLGRLLFILGDKFEGNKRYRLKNLGYRCRYYRYFKHIVKRADAVVFAVGMLKYSTQDFSYVYDMVNAIAENYRKPVMMSAMSIASPSEEDWRFRQLVKAVNRKSVKVITTRDGIDGLNGLKSIYLKDSTKVAYYVGDPALWIPEVYGVEKSKGVKHNKIIGIGLIRNGIFADYGNDYSDDKLQTLYAQIIKEIEARGYEWRLFSNGMQLDMAFGRNLIKRFNLPEKNLIPATQDTKRFLRIFEEFRGVIGFRLHSCITSVALGVPVAGIIWDDKLRYFSRSMGIDQFFSDVNELDASLIVDKLEAAMAYDGAKIPVEEYRAKTKDTIAEFVGQVERGAYGG